jgi:hypothetical protein
MQGYRQEDFELADLVVRRTRGGWHVVKDRRGAAGVVIDEVALAIRLRERPRDRVLIIGKRSAPRKPRLDS